jgi:hypothetical protein
MGEMMPEPRYGNVKSSNYEVFALILISFGRNIPHNDAISADSSPSSNGYISDNSGARPYDHTVSNRWMTLFFCKSSRAQSDIVINHYVIANNCGLSDNYTHSMVNKKSSPDSSSGMYFNPSYGSNPI